MNLDELDPEASYYGWRNRDSGSVTGCEASLDYVRRSMASTANLGVQNKETVAWVGGEYVVVPDGWPAPKDERVTVDEIVRVLVEELHPFQNETAMRIREHGIVQPRGYEDQEGET
jgi:hypothetical protein